MNLFKLFLCLAFLFCSSLFAQNKKDTSKVLMSTIGERYVGPVKKGLASGKGEAFGIKPLKIGNRLLWSVDRIAALLNQEQA